MAGDFAGWTAEHYATYRRDLPEVVVSQTWTDSPAAEASEGTSPHKPHSARETPVRVFFLKRVMSQSIP